MFVQCLGLFGRLSCSIFILISGFYMVEQKAEDHYRRIDPVMAEMVFYSLTIWLALVLVGGRPFFPWGEAVNAFLPFFRGNWFLVYYLVFYPFVPFVNAFIRSMDQKTYKRLLLILYVVWPVVPTITMHAWAFSNVDYFLVMYLTGAYIRLYVHGKTTYDNRRNLAV